MKTADTDGAAPGYELRSELARRSLRAAEADPDRRLAWVNSIALLFLLIGLVGSRLATAQSKPLPPVAQPTAVGVEPLPPPHRTPERPSQPTGEPAPAETPAVVVVTPETPAIQFAVPTMGNLLVPQALAQAPRLVASKAAVALREVPAALAPTGSAGERPLPPYPRLALDQGQEGSVTLRLTADDAGLIQTIEVAHSSGFPALDRSALEYVKRHWTVPSGKGNRAYEATIVYKLQMN